jgi:hypothetical protein
MSIVKLYIGSDLADFNERFNVMFSIGDINDISFGNANKSYTLTLPLTKQNKKLLKFINQADVKSEPTATGRLYLDELLIISGSVKVQGYDEYSASIIISSDEWIDALKDRKMVALDLSASDHLLTHATVEDSWSAAYPVYRYPMIDFGGLQSMEAGTTAKWYPTDFIPMISVATLINKILAPYTISSSWIGTAFVKNLYILAKETIANDDFITGKNLATTCEGATANYNTATIANGASGTASLTNYVIKFSHIDTNEGSHYNGTTGEYTVPETGTYRFIASVVVQKAGTVSLTETIGSLALSINQTGSASRTLASDSAASIVNNSVHSLDTGYCHLVAGDKVTVKTTMYSTSTNSSGGSGDLTIGIQGTSTLEAVWGNANKYSGLNKNISLEEMLPDMTQLDFLAAIRDIFNLRFWMDRMKRTVYIEPWDSFISSTVVDITSLIDHSSKPADLISQNYNKTITLKWKDDNDEAYNDYVTYHTDSYLKKDITLSSLYAKNGTETREHPFSSIVEGPGYVISTAVQLPRIYKTFPVTPYYFFDRKVNFNTRLVEWKGLTAGLTWHYESETKNTYPKIAGVDWSAIHTGYWMKLMHYIDKGKMYTLKMKVKPGFLTQFFTVVNSASTEGFRPTYKATINGIDNYFFLQKLTSDGESAEVEMILKQ